MANNIIALRQTIRKPGIMDEPLFNVLSKNLGIEKDDDNEKLLKAVELLFALNVHCHTLYPVYLVDQLVVHQTLRAIKHNNEKARPDRSIEEAEKNLVKSIKGDASEKSKSLREIYDVFGKNTLSFRLLMATSLIDYASKKTTGEETMPTGSVVDSILSEKLNQLSLKNTNLQQDLRTLAIRKDLEIEQLQKQISDSEYLKNQIQNNVQQALESVVAGNTLKVTTNFNKDQLEEENKRLIKVNSAMKLAYDEKSTAAQNLYTQVLELKSKLSVYVEVIAEYTQESFKGQADVKLRDLT